MIEKSFMLGVRFKWTWPSDYTGGVGTIIDNPIKAAVPMVYDGMDGELYNLSAPHVSTLGLTMGKSIPINWLYFKEYSTTKIKSGGDVVTGDMSGCIIATWTAGGRCVCHVGTGPNAEMNKKVKTTFAAAMPPTAIGYDPAAAWPTAEIRRLSSKFSDVNTSHKIVGLVTSSNQLFAILLFRQNNGADWICGGIKSCTAMPYATLKAKMTT